MRFERAATGRTATEYTAPAGDFAKSYAGIRAQLVSADGELVTDPLFGHTDASTHVLNAVSPGLTSSLPLGEYLAEHVLERFDEV